MTFGVRHIKGFLVCDFAHLESGFVHLECCFTHTESVISLVY